MSKFPDKTTEEHVRQMQGIPNVETKTRALLKWLKEETTPTFHFSDEISGEVGGTYTRFTDSDGKPAAKNGYGHSFTLLK